MTTPQKVEFLYGIDSTVSDDSRFYEPPRVVQFRITKKTSKRIYYVAKEFVEYAPRIRYVDRQAIERDGHVTRRTGGWWEPDLTVYLQPPSVERPKAPTVAELKAAMAAAHPDRGGTDAEFIAARARYERARAAEGVRP